MRLMWLPTLAVCTFASTVVAQTVTPEFAGTYSALSLGTPSGLPTRAGGLFILTSQPNTLYIGGQANTASGALYSIGLNRDSGGFITGFSGSVTRVADAPFNDGGFVVGPQGLVTYAQYPENALGQIDLSTGTVVNTIPLSPFGVGGSSVASVNIVPSGYPGAGGLRIASWNSGNYYEVQHSFNSAGILTVTGATQLVANRLPGGPEGFAYVPLGSDLFDSPSMIVSEYSADAVAVYELDSQGHPIISTRRQFVSGLSGAEGAAIDPLTGSFLFSTFGGGDRVVVVRGFAIPEPSSAALLALAGLVAIRRRR